jgi:hypothetical protein
MSGKPHQSCLIPCENEIASLRRRRPPMPYTQIAELLQQKYSIAIRAPAIFKFIKVRSGGRKVFSYGQTISVEKPASVQPPSQRVKVGSGLALKPIFEFPYSERYNRHRLPPEEAAARRKKLEEEGH